MKGLRQRTGLRPGQIERTLFSFYEPTVLPWLAPASGRSWRATDPWLRDHSAACPLCVQASGGRWLLSWRLKWTFLCADHLMYLVDRCPRCHTRLYWRRESTGPARRPPWRPASRQSTPAWRATRRSPRDGRPPGRIGLARPGGRRSG
ncbi:TniQ family protein [Streptomyces sp. ISL-98]|uniref:TniQ family protein n=1 Tax=Streptomyces sp. ISL-98 TaxID=2819192 RepID=UPI001BEABB46|nr:TniQ family protein [Streptomyces sp. ISL-98]